MQVCPEYYLIEQQVNINFSWPFTNSTSSFSKLRELLSEHDQKPHKLIIVKVILQHPSEDGSLTTKILSTSLFTENEFIIFLFYIG